MAIRVWGAFAAGVAVGWTGRHVFGSGRELLVKGVVLAHQVREYVARNAAEQVEWVEDMFAEGTARYQASRSDVDEHSHTHVPSPRASSTGAKDAA